MLEDSSKPVDTSSQASLWVVMPYDVEPINQTLGEICTPTTPPAKTPGPGAGILPKNMVQLQKEVNKVLECLPMTRSSLDACWWKQVSDYTKYMALHQIEPEATKSIREAKALCGSTFREAEAHHTTLFREAEAQHTTLVREAKANCASIITEAEVHCTTAIRNPESHCDEHAHSIQQSHAEGMQCWRWKP